jgi:integrase
MSDTDNFPSPVRRTPWNKGKLIGARPPLRSKHVWSIRTRLQVDGRVRDLAMFNLAIDSKLRGCDVVALKVEDVAPNGYAIDRATVRQKKTGRPVKFELTDQTRQAVDDYLKTAGKKIRRLSIHWKTRQRAVHNDAAVRATCVGVDRQPRIRFKTIWHPFASANQGHSDLSPNRKPASGAASTWPHQDRKHRQIPRY